MIKFEHVTKSFRLQNGQRKVIFKDLNVSIPNLNVGIFGKNGAGKSTLLLLLAKTISPDKGRIIHNCNISWPVGLSSGFHRSMTARDNILFVCRINGFSLYSSNRIVDFVKEFAELKEYFDMPVATYSSGMMARLGFSLSMAFDFDVYLADEVTAVGDVEFNKKSEALFKSKRNKSKIIMVSHSPDTIKQWCDVAFYLENGQLTFYEDIGQAIKRYNEQSHEITSF